MRTKAINKKTLIVILGLLLAVVTFQPAAQGCTGIELRNSDGSIVHGHLQGLSATAGRSQLQP